jgi:predicted secreted protein
MALAAHPLKFYLRSDVTTPTSADEVAGINSVDFGPSIDLLDVTDFKDATGAKIKLAALTDGSIGVSGDLAPTDAPQILFRSLFLSGASAWATVHFNPSGSAGQKGFQVETKVASYKISAKVDGKAEFSAELQFTGAVVAV